MPLKRIEPGKRMSAAVIHGGKVYLAGFVAEAAPASRSTSRPRTCCRRSTPR